MIRILKYAFSMGAAMAGAFCGIFFAWTAGTYFMTWAILLFLSAEEDE